MMQSIGLVSEQQRHKEQSSCIHQTQRHKVIETEDSSRCVSTLLTTRDSYLQQTRPRSYRDTSLKKGLKRWEMICPALHYRWVVHFYYYYDGDNDGDAQLTAHKCYCVTFVYLSLCSACLIEPIIASTEDKPHYAWIYPSSSSSTSQLIFTSTTYGGFTSIYLCEPRYLSQRLYLPPGRIKFSLNI